MRDAETRDVAIRACVADKRVRVASRRVRKALDEVLRVAREYGFEPCLYFESAGGIHVMDKRHAGLEHPQRDGNAMAAVLFTLPDSLPHGSDHGGVVTAPVEVTVTLEEATEICEDVPFSLTTLVDQVPSLRMREIAGGSPLVPMVALSFEFDRGEHGLCTIELVLTAENWRKLQGGGDDAT